MLNKIKTLIKRITKARKYGIRYLFDQKYRRKCYAKEINKIRRKRIGSSFFNNKKQIKSTLFRKKGNKCFWCNEPMNFSDATIDHIVPVKKGGNNYLHNLRLIHEKCRKERDTAIDKGIIVHSLPNNN